MRATISPETGRNYATRTIDRRVSTVVSLYKWAIRSPYRALFAEGVVAEIESIIRNRNDLDQDLDADEQQHVSLIQPAQARHILHCAGPTPREMCAKEYLRRCTQNPELSEIIALGSSRNRLAMDIALGAGLRVSEVCGLGLMQFESFLGREPLAETEVVQIAVKGKGSKTRNVDFSGSLINEIAEYVKSERAGVILLTGRNDTKALLVNSLSANRNAGARTSVRTLERAFSSACVEVGCSKTATLSKLDDDGSILALVQKTVPLFVFHDLRHSFAIWTYYGRKRAGDSEPWMYIQKQLGHAHLTTTLKIYLSAAQDFEAHISDMAVKHLNAKV